MTSDLAAFRDLEVTFRVLLRKLKPSFDEIGRRMGMMMRHPVVLRFFEQLGSYDRYARGQRKKKPRGRRAKARSRELWQKHLERRRKA